MIKYYIIFLVIFFPNFGFSKSIVADLSSDSISINTGFNGAELLLFGSFDGLEDDDLVISVEGPKADTIIYKKEYVSGIWINRENVTFENVPSFYYTVYSNTNMDLENLTLLKREKIGIANLELKSIKELHSEKLNVWRNSLERRMRKRGMWVLKKGRGPESIEIKKNKLFRAPVIIPATVLPGEYKVSIFLLRNGKILSKETTKISIQKTGLEARIYNFAHEHSMLYGVFAVLLALCAGYIAAFSFRKI